MPKDIGQAMNDAVIRGLAGAQSYPRGLDYFSHGHVESIEEDGGSIHAVVRGDQNYTVKLSADDGVLDYSCGCTGGSGEAFCKHCVAAALAWLNRAEASGKPARRGKTRQFTLTDAGKILQPEDKDTLVRTMLDWAKDDDQLRERLIIYAARRAGPESAAAAVQRAFERAVQVREYAGSREAAGWARRVVDVIDSIDQLLEDGQAAAVVLLCESALQSLVAEGVDDSDGHVLQQAAQHPLRGLPRGASRYSGVGTQTFSLGVAQRLRCLLRRAVAICKSWVLTA